MPRQVSSLVQAAEHVLNAENVWPCAMLCANMSITAVLTHKATASRMVMDMFVNSMARGQTLSAFSSGPHRDAHLSGT